MATAPSQHRGQTSGHDWRAQLGAKLVAADEAVSHIKSGDRVCLSIAQQTPFELCPALAGRLMELENVVVNHGAAVMNWDLPGLGERFRLESMYLSPYDRAIYHRGDADFTPIVYYRAGHLPPALDNFNVYLMTVSPPDEHGYCNFGEAQIMSKLLARNANLVIAEIDKKSIRVGGDNSIHISEINYFVERTIELPEINLPQPGEEEARNIATVCGTVAKELIPDRATIQIGVGSMSGMLCKHLLNHHELGMQTEIIPLHTAPLVEAGVITGKHKKLFPGLVVGAGIAPLTPREELDFIDGNPAFALYDFNTTDDIRFVAQEEGLISVNNAMAVDLTGQTNGESIGPLMYTGHRRADGVRRRGMPGGRQDGDRRAVELDGPGQAHLAHRAGARRGQRGNVAARLRASRGDRIRHRKSEGQIDPSKNRRTGLNRAPRLQIRTPHRSQTPVQSLSALAPMVEINPTRIKGRWSNGFTLDLHTTSSELVGHDEYGHPRFESKRSELGELLYKLKFRRNKSVIPEIAEVVGHFAESYLPKVDLIVPVPPSTPRKEQPVIMLAHAIGERIGIPVFEDCVWKVRETSQLKNVFDFDERSRLLDGAFEIDRAVANGKTVLLFDDLYRSGATLNAVTSLLYDQGGVKDVVALTLTRTRNLR